MTLPMPDEKAAYETIRNSKEKFGVFYKTCFHIHTPESYDYKLLGLWKPEDYKKATEQEIFDVCIERGAFPKALTLDDINLEDAHSCYCNKKELLSYMLLADKLITNDIEVVLVTDHHTIEGVTKLEVAIKELCKMKKHRVFPEVLLGIEISCADKNHVVGIFENNEDIKIAITTWLKKYLLSKKEGTYKTSIEVLEFIKSIRGIGYLAHADTSDIFKKKFLSGAYKKKLFTSDALQLVGISDYKKMEFVKNHVKNFRSSDIKVILDNDAHDVDAIPDKIFWIKGSKRNYSMVKEALDDYDISVNFENCQDIKQYIKGIYIEKSEDGFLKGKENDDFCLNFSKSLNCMIGGRGVGKSSVLEMLEYILSQRCVSDKRLDFMCLHGNAWILYEYHGDEFLIEMIMPFKKNSEDNILRYFGQNLSDRYHYRYHFSKNEVEDYAFKHFLKISKIIHKNEEWYLETVKNKRKMLDCFFDIRYSVNDLVNTAGGDEIKEFLYETLFKNSVLSKPKNIVRFRSKSGLIKALVAVQDFLERRKKEVKKVIDPFNDSQKNILRIVYSQDNICEEPDIATWVFGTQYKESEWYGGYNITNENIIEYLFMLYEKLGIFEFLKMIVCEDITQAFSIRNITEYCIEMNKDMVEQEISFLNERNAEEVLTNIFRCVVADNNLNMIIDYLKKYITDVESFSLEFNIRNREGDIQTPIYKPVGNLSLGQKVVAMLSFVLGYSEYSKDYRPLIIDQPEDNLDNQYIYKNLVKQLRSIKDKRQVILATHNATIVTNAKADQVCVMASDNLHGWIETTGYPGERRIKKYIINYLEGGIESFLHKISIYEDALEIHIDR